VVLIHGFSLDRRVWLPQLPMLRQSFRVVTYDCRGFGRSSRPAGLYNHAEDLHCLLSHLGVTSAHLVGLSMGGRIALHYAIRWPDLVSSLAVIGSDVGGYRHRIGWDVSLGPRGLAATRSAWLRHELFDTVRQNPRAWHLVQEMVDGYSGWHWQWADVRSPVDTDTRYRLADIRASTTVIVGEHDLPDFHEVAELLATGLPQAQKVVVAGAGHLVNLEKPATCNEILGRYLRTEARG